MPKRLILIVGCSSHCCIGPGDEVIVPSYTFISTATCIELVGAKTIFVDVEPDYFCLDVESVKNAITPRTKAVIGVHLFGQPYAPELIDLCEKEGLVLVEDAAQAHGCLLYTSPSPRDRSLSRMPSSA